MQMCFSFLKFLPKMADIATKIFLWNWQLSEMEINVVLFFVVLKYSTSVPFKADTSKMDAT